MLDLRLLRCRAACLWATAAWLMMPACADAQSRAWSDALSGNWSDTNRWDGGIVADGTNITAEFSLVDLTTNVTCHLDSPRTIGRLVFADADTNSPAAWVLDHNDAAGNILSFAASTAPTTIAILNQPGGAAISAPVNLANRQLDVSVAAGNVLNISGDLTTSVAGETVQLRLLGPGICSVSGQVFKPADPGLRQVHVMGGVANFVDTHIYTTAFNLGVFTSANAYIALHNTSVDINTAGQWWGRVELGGSGMLTSMTMYGGTLSIPNNALSIMGYTGQRGKTILWLDRDARVNAEEIWIGEVDYNYGAMVVVDATLNIQGRIQLGGAKGAGEVHQLGGSVSCDGPLGMQYRLSQNSAWGIYNLHDGTLTCDEIQSGDGVENTTIYNHTYFNFHGGTLRPARPSVNFVKTTITGAHVGIAAPQLNVYAGGAVIDTAGHNITISQPLRAPTGAGVVGGLITLPEPDKGKGYKGAPVLYFSNAAGDTTGVGAAAIAIMTDDGRGSGTFKIDAVRITNPGLNYSAAPTLQVFGGDASAAAVLPVLAVATNVSGGLTKQGLGTLTLTGSNTYTGDTVVVAGTLAVAQAWLADQSALHLSTNATFAIEFAGEDEIRALYYDNHPVPRGVYRPGDLNGALGGRGRGHLRVATGPAPGLHWILR